MLFAPGRLSTTIGCPSAAEIFCVTRRVVTSVMPPPVYGTIQRMGLLGYDCAPEALLKRKRTAKTSLYIARSFDGWMLLEEIFVHFEAEAGRLQGPDVAVLVDVAGIRHQLVAE